MLRPILEDGPKKIVHDFKKIYNAFYIKGIFLFPVVFDTMLASYILEPDSKEFDLISISKLYLKVQISDKESCEKSSYFSERIECIKNLTAILKEKLANNDRLKLLEDLELPLVKVLSEMELSGISIDEQFLNVLKQETKELIFNLENKIYDLAGEKFNILATKKLAEILFEKLNLPAKKKTKKGYSTDSIVLDELSDKHPLPAMILEYRHISKLINTHIEVFPEMIHKKTKRLHTYFDQTGAAT